jgi:hypothetical protein
MNTAHSLADLGDRVATDGPAAHHLLLAHLAALVADTAPGAASALQDPAAPAFVRQRALAVASADLLRRTAIPTSTDSVFGRRLTLPAVQRCADAQRTDKDKS